MARPFRIAGPAYLANAAANIYTPPASTIYAVILHIHLTNVTTAARTYTLYIGATGGSAGGTEIAKDISIPAKSVWDLHFRDLYMASTDFLTGVADAASSITILVLGKEIVV